MKRIISMVLILAMSMALCIPAFADESEIPTDSAAEPVSDMRIMYQTGMSENGIARDSPLLFRQKDAILWSVTGDRR